MQCLQYGVYCDHQQEGKMKMNTISHIVNDFCYRHCISSAYVYEFCKQYSVSDEKFRTIYALDLIHETERLATALIGCHDESNHDFIYVTE